MDTDLPRVVVDFNDRDERGPYSILAEDAPDGPFVAVTEEGDEVGVGSVVGVRNGVVLVAVPG